MLKQLPTPETLRKLLRYEPLTGKLFWRERTPDMFSGTKGRSAAGCCANWNAKHSGKEALTYQDKDGYYQGRVFGKLIKAHTAIVAIMTGKMPEEVDHENGIPSNNKWRNLKSVTHAQNQRNMKLRKDSKYPVHGIYIRPSGRYAVGIHFDGKRYGLGTYDTLDEAVDVRIAAQKRFGFHKNHGQR